MLEKRFIAFIIDCGILILISCPLIAASIFYPKNIIEISFSLIFTLLICKDNFTGQSFGKRIMKIQIVNHKTLEFASNLKCIFRNMLLCLWPIELAFVIIKPYRRLGDFATKTKIVVVSKSIPLKISKRNILNPLICFLIVYAITIISINISINQFPLIRLLFTK